jgi:hypothetical protein
MLDKLANENGYKKWFSDWRFWAFLASSLITATIAWANIKSDIAKYGQVIDNNCKKIDSLEKSLPTIDIKLTQLLTDMEWVKRNIK